MDEIEVIRIEIPREEFERKIVSLIESLLLVDEKVFVDEAQGHVKDAA
jgi:hypothetical protein